MTWRAPTRRVAGGVRAWRAGEWRMAGAHAGEGHVTGGGLPPTQGLVWLGGDL